MNNIEKITTLIQTAGTVAELEMKHISQSLKSNGIAIIKGFIGESQKLQLQRDAAASVQLDYDAGVALGASIKMVASSATAEFRHPLLVSKAAAELVTNSSLLNIIEGYLDSGAIIHHALFQQSVPISVPAVDWHVDTGSNKALNGALRFSDKRLRMIVYLTDVKSGGLSYIIDSRDAAEHFLRLPQEALYPQIDIPTRRDKIVTVNAAAGTIILFDAHGLHRPEPPVDTRLVLNVWFARSDFSASLPPVLVSIANVPQNQLNNIYVFRNERGNQLRSITRRRIEKPALWRRLINKVKRRALNDSK